MRRPSRLSLSPADPDPSTPASLPAHAPRECSTRSVLAGVVTCLVIAGLLSSTRLVSVAEQQEFGANRDRWTTAAEQVDGIASGLRLDRPANGLGELLYESESEGVVLGELANTTSAAGGKTKLLTTSLPPSRLPDQAPTDSSTPNSGTENPTTTSSPDDISDPELPSTTLTIPPAITTSTVPPKRRINAEDPLRVWTGGDSLGEYVGSRLLYKVADPDFATITLDYHISTGLTRPDYFDWPASLSQTMVSEEDPLIRPEAVIFMAGGNDDQPMRADGERLATNSEEWLDEYRARVQTMMDITAYGDARLYWIGLPPMKDERREAIAVNVNAILADEAANREWVTFVDIVPLLLNEDGVYDQYIIGPDGEQRKARERDGVHVTSQASEWISRIVWDLVQLDWAFDEETPKTAPSIPESIPDASTTTSSTGN